MPVTGLPVAVEAVLESLMSQYHLVSWQVTGGDSGVVLILRWSFGSSEASADHRSPARTPPSARRRSPHHRCHHRDHGGGRSTSRRTSQWLTDQQQQTRDDLSSTHRDHLSEPSDPSSDPTPPTSPPSRRSHHWGHRYHSSDSPPPGSDSGTGSEDEDSDPPPLPPPPPLLQGYSDTTGSGTGSRSGTGSGTGSGSSETQDTIVDSRNRKSRPREASVWKNKVTIPDAIQENEDTHTRTRSKGDPEDNLERKGRKSKAKKSTCEPEGILKKRPVGDKRTGEKVVTVSESVIVHEEKTTEIGDTKDNEYDVTDNLDDEARNRRYHFRELIRKHSDGIKKLAAEQRRKERDRQRLRRLETAKSKSRLRAHSEDNLLSRENSHEGEHSEESLRARSEANILSSKNEDGARRVRFSDAGAINKPNTEQQENQGEEGDGEEKGAEGGAAVESTEGAVEGEGSAETTADDSGSDSSDAEEVGHHEGPRRIGAMFRIGAMVARQKRKRNLLT